ncbi:hypothetical protein A9Q81_05610 [Gammaproteobacteria bacterium 42_54_T18]|nr:hypothetical protein A9Q81_05610 [Gammaproteobacteria bacterium 42_54_T18]
MWYFLIAIMVLVVLVLSVVAWNMWQKVFATREAEKIAKREKNEAQALAAQEKIDYIFESLNVIASSLLNDQVRVAEGCIRMAVLMDNLPLSCESKHYFLPVFEVYHQTRHIPTHEQWKALDRKQQKAFEQELFAIEKRMLEPVKEIMVAVKDKPFSMQNYIKQH